MKLAFNPRSILLNPCVNDLSLTRYGLPFKLAVAVVIELRQQRTFLPLAMAEVLSWNQMDHDKSSLCESPLYVCDSATPSLSALVYTRCSLVHPNLRIPSKRVPSLKLLSDPSSASW
jgi:hypothetical protein